MNYVHPTLTGVRVEFYLILYITLTGSFQSDGTNFMVPSFELH